MCNRTYPNGCLIGSNRFTTNCAGCNYKAPTSISLASIALAISPTSTPTQISSLSSSVRDTFQSSTVLYGAIGGAGVLLLLMSIVSVFYYRQRVKRQKVRIDPIKPSKMMSGTQLPVTGSKLKTFPRDLNTHSSVAKPKNLSTPNY